MGRWLKWSKRADELSAARNGSAVSRPFTPAHHEMPDPSKMTRVRVSPEYDLRDGHAQTRLTWPEGDSMDAELQRLIDRQEIADLCARYMFALDRKDWTTLESCFTDTPVFVHPGGRIEGFDAILARSRGALESLDASQHLLGNVVVDVDGDTARSTCYFQAQHVRAGTPGGDTYIIAGSYTDTLSRTPGGWKIAERVQAYLWRDGNRAVVSR